MDCYQLAKDCGLETPPEYLKGKYFRFWDEIVRSDWNILTKWVNNSIKSADHDSEDRPYSKNRLRKVSLETGRDIVSEDEVRKFLLLYCLGRQCAIEESNQYKQLYCAGFIFPNMY